MQNSHHQSSCPSSYNETTTQLAKLCLDTTTPTFKSDSETRVTFSDPCSITNNKKRRICSLHQTISFKPRKKLNSLSPFQFTNSSLPFLSSSPSSCSYSTPTSSSSSSFLDHLRRCNSLPLPSPVNNNTVSQISPFSSPPSSAVNLGSYPSSAKESPTTASFPPRPPKKVYRRTVSDVTPVSSASKTFLNSSFPERKTGDGGGVSVPGSSSESETRMEKSPAMKSLKEKMEKSVGDYSDFMKKLFQEECSQEQEEEAYEVYCGEENLETEEVEEPYCTSLKCTCGKSYKLVYSVAAE